MSYAIARLVKRLTLKAAPRNVLETLASYCDDDGGECFPGLPRIAAEAGVSVRSAIRYIATFERRGLLSREQHRGPQPNRYQLDVEAIAAAARPSWCRRLVVPKVPNVSIDPDPLNTKTGAADASPPVRPPRPLGPKGWTPAPARLYQRLKGRRVPEPEPTYRWDWFDACQRHHGGACGGQLKHWMQTQIDAARGLVTPRPPGAGETGWATT